MVSDPTAKLSPTTVAPNLLSTFIGIWADGRVHVGIFARYKETKTEIIR